MDAWIKGALSQAVSHVERIAADLIARERTGFPHITRKHEWQETPDGVWTGGFWAGLLWLAYEQNAKKATLEQACRYTDRLLPKAQDLHNHDLGFMFFPSAIKGWELTGNLRYHDSALFAARHLGQQFNEKGGFIPGWGFFGGRTGVDPYR